MADSILIAGEMRAFGERERRDALTQETLSFSPSASFITAVSRVQVERRNLRNEWFVREPKKEEGDEEHVSKLEEN